MFKLRAAASHHLKPSLAAAAPSVKLVRPMSSPAPSRASEQQLKQLGSFSSCEISDALVKLKVVGGGYVPDLEVFSEGKEESVVGEAFTVKMVDQRETEAPKLSGHMVDLAPPGSIMVISSPSHVKSASFGGLLGAGASVKGVKAVVIDGRCRDLAELRKVNLPVFARGHSTLGQSPFTRASEVQVPLTIRALLPTPHSSAGTAPEWPSTTVNPSDLILADADGVVVVPAERLEEVLQAAKEGKEVDERCMADILAGKGVKESFEKHRGNTKKH